MSSYPRHPTFATVLRSFGSADGCPFAAVLTERDIQDACDAEGVRFGQGEQDVYTPAVTLWAFLAQCLSASKSCVAAVERQAPGAWRWHDRRVLLADGFEVSMPDTPANQGAYPQLRNQVPGLGFPRMRVVVLLAFATACLIGAALGPCKGKGTGETELFRALLARLDAGDLVVADRYYCSWWIVALLVQRGVDACFRLHHLRDYDFRRG